MSGHNGPDMADGPYLPTGKGRRGDFRPDYGA